MTEDNSIFIGNKPFMNYVTGVVMQFTTKGANTVFIKARGKFISRAVDVSEVSAKRFLDERVFVNNIRIDSEEFKNQEGRNVRVSTIEIELIKKESMGMAQNQSVDKTPEQPQESPLSNQVSPEPDPLPPPSEPMQTTNW